MSLESFDLEFSAMHTPGVAIADMRRIGFMHPYYDWLHRTVETTDTTLVDLLHQGILFGAFRSMATRHGLRLAGTHILTDEQLTAVPLPDIEAKDIDQYDATINTYLGVNALAAIQWSEMTDRLTAEQLIEIGFWTIGDLTSRGAAEIGAYPPDLAANSGKEILALVVPFTNPFDVHPVDIT